MKREIFRRGVRMQHQFGETEKRNDFFGPRTFDPKFPVAVDNLSKRGTTGGMSIQENGEHQHFEARSPVQKPSGAFASLNGPVPDPVDEVSRPAAVGTVRRKI